MPVYVSMVREVTEDEKKSLEAANEEVPTQIETRVIKSAFENVWQHRGWKLAENPDEAITAGEADDSTVSKHAREVAPVDQKNGDGSPALPSGNQTGSQAGQADLDKSGAKSNDPSGISKP